MKKQIFYIAMAIVSLQVVNIGCKENEVDNNDKLLLPGYDEFSATQGGNHYEVNGKFGTQPDTIPYKYDSLSQMFRILEGHIIDWNFEEATTYIMDTSGKVAERDSKGKWTIYNCEGALEAWYKMDSSRRANVVYDTLLISNGTPIQFANNKQ